MKPAPENLVIRSVSVPSVGPGTWDVVIRNGRFADFTKKFTGDVEVERDGQSCILLPGFIDGHVHLNEPGRSSWEGLLCGTRALAAGGVTTFFDMPLNSNPPCLTAQDLHAKRALAMKKSLMDFGLWGGLVPGNASEIAGLAKAGAIGIKSFLSPSGLAEFPQTDLKTLKTGASACAKHNLVLGVHAEDPEILDLMQGIEHSGNLAPWEKFVRSRPELAEFKAVEMCIRVAAETGCAFHIVHVSSPEALDLIQKARRRGVDISSETCPHYLLLDPACMESLGARAKCAPPLRFEPTRRALWSALQAGRITTLGSDHSPCLPGMKLRKDFEKAWGGISGAQHGLLLFMQEARRRRLPWKNLVNWTSQNTAKRFGLKRKTGLKLGADADFVLLQKQESLAIREEELLSRHPLSPYVGRQLEWRVAGTYVRGRAVYENGTPKSPGNAVDVRLNSEKIL